MSLAVVGITIPSIPVIDALVPTATMACRASAVGMGHPAPPRNSVSCRAEKLTARMTRRRRRTIALNVSAFRARRFPAASLHAWLSPVTDASRGCADEAPEFRQRRRGARSEGDKRARCLVRKTHAQPSHDAGGILANPGVRGVGERGEKMHTSQVRLNVHDHGHTDTDQPRHRRDREERDDA